MAGNPGPDGRDEQEGLAVVPGRRAWRRALAVAAGFAAALALSACDPNALHLTVNSVIDGVDAEPGDGVCEVTAGAADCSLRAAVMEANATPGFDNIYLPASVFSIHTLTLGGAGEDDAATGDLDILENVSISTDGSSPHAVIHGGGDRVFDVHDGMLNMARVVVRDGDTTNGAGILVRSGAELLLAGGTITANDATAGSGGVAGETGSKITLQNVTVSANTGTVAGGVGSSGTLALERSTVSANTGTAAGGLHGAGTLTLTQVTVSGNTATAGVGGVSSVGATSAAASFVTIAGNTGTAASAWSGPATVTGTAIEGSGVLCTATLASGGYNVSPGATCLDGSGTADQPNTQPRLGTLVSAGGATQTRVPRPGSPLLDAVPLGAAGCGTTLASDQRGQARPQEGSCEIGSVEVQRLAPFVVSSAVDATDTSQGNGLCRTSGGVCTLRAAVQEANAWPYANEIVLSSGTTYPFTRAGQSEFSASTGDLNVADVLTVRASGAALATVDGADLDRVFNVGSGGALTLQRVRVTNGTTPFGTGGGIVVQSGGLHLVESRIDGNASTHPAGGGGGIGVGVASTVVIEASTIDANTAVNTGGGIRVDTSAATSVQVVRSTLSGNQAAVGGALHVGTTPVTVADSTITANRGTTNTGGIHVVGGSVSVARSIVADQSQGPDCTLIVGTLTSGGHNLESATSCGFTATGDQQSTFPGLDALADAGGPTPTHVPPPGSPALDAAGTGCGLLDQRGLTRPTDADGSLTAECDTGAVESGARVFAVTTTADGADAVPGDGVCEATPGSADCTLRAAVGEANAWPGYDTIVLGAGPYPLTLAGPGEHAAATGDLDLTDDVTLEATGPGLATVAGGGGDRVFEVRDGAWVTMRRLAVTGGDVAASGAGVLVGDGTLVLEAGRIHGNDSGAAPGGGVAVLGGSVASLIASTVDANASGTAGGGLYVAGADTVVAVSLSTFSGNTGDGVHVDTSAGAWLGMGDSTVTANGGSGIRVTGLLPVDVGTSIVAAQTAGPDCVGTIVSGGGNVESATSCGFVAPGDQQAVAPLLAPLGDYGGPTPTHRPAFGSPVIDAAGFGCSPEDQRGEPRPLDGDGDAGAECDAGAVEVSWAAAPLALVVDTSADAVDAVPGDGACATAGGACTLRAAVMETNAWPAADVVTLGPQGATLARPGQGEDLSVTGDLDIHDDLVVESSTAALAHVTGASLDRVFHVHGPISVTLRRIAVGLGSVANGHGGGIRVDGATLVLDRSHVVLNEADGPANRGGGVAAFGGADVTVLRSTIALNTAGTWGGGVLAEGAGTRVRLERATVSGNAGTHGGGVYGLVSGTGAVEVVDSTVTANVAGTGAGLRRSTGTFTVTRSIVADQTTGVDCAGTFTSGGSNLESATTCGFTAAGDRQSAEALLGTLGDNGGPTATHLPTVSRSATSDAVDAHDACVGTDQRDRPAPVDGDADGVARCDVGAVEVDAPVTFVAIAHDSPDVNAGDGLCANGGGVCTLRAAVMEANAAPERLHVIELDGPYHLGSGPDGDAAGDLDVRGWLVVRPEAGATANITTSVTTGLVQAHPDARLELRDVQLSFGTAPFGGALFVGAGAHVTVTDAELRSNHATIAGGAVYVDGGSFTATRTILEANRAQPGQICAHCGGGAVALTATPGGSVVIEASLLRGNSAPSGYALLNEGAGTVTVADSTITENSSEVGSEHVFDEAAVHAAVGSAVTFRNSIVAAQTGGRLDCAGPAAGAEAPTSLGHNLESTSTCAFFAPGDLRDTDPMLAPFTAIPQPGSPAINGGPVSCGSLDLVGVGRPLGLACDRGAREVG